MLIHPHRRIVVTAASGPVPMSELGVGVARLRRAGWDVRIDTRVESRASFFAGDDKTRAEAFWDSALDDSSDVVWMARGGYGAARILPELQHLTADHGSPKPKVLCGYSDVTALHEFVRSRWGWRTVHCSMPTGSRFLSESSADELAACLAVVLGEPAPQPAWAESILQPVPGSVVPPQVIAGPLVGGNLTVIASLVGTPFAVTPPVGGLLFLEDVGEAPYRIDRYLNQLRQAGALRGLGAIVLGTFTDCNDTASKLSDGTDLRAAMTEPQWKQAVFGTLSCELGLPVLQELPVGHGPVNAAIELGERYEIRAGRISLMGPRGA
jgi:muramoyltetrapeptide carboxypeptidase